MFNKLKTLTLIMVLAVWTFSCRDISKSETTVIVDSLRNVELNFPDSLRTIDMVDAKVEVSKYFDNIGRYYLDTVSTLSSVSLALQSKAYNLRQKLLKVLPKISLTTGIGDDRLTREYYIVEGDMKLDRDELLLYCQRRLQKLDTNVLEKIEVH